MEQELADFRMRVRGFIADHAPPIAARGGTSRPRGTRGRRRCCVCGSGVVYAEGLSGGDWPVEYGGRADHHPLQDRIVSEEILRARAPRPIHQVNLAAHVLLHFGSDREKATYLCRRSAAASTSGVSCSANPTQAATSRRCESKGMRQKGADGQMGDLWAQDMDYRRALGRHGVGSVRTDPCHATSRSFGLPGADGPRPDRGPADPTVADSIEINEVLLDGVRPTRRRPRRRAGDRAGRSSWRDWTSSGSVSAAMSCCSSSLIEDLVASGSFFSSRTLHGKPLTPRSRTPARRISELAVEAEVAKAFIDDYIERMLPR